MNAIWIIDTDYFEESYNKKLHQAFSDLDIKYFPLNEPYINLNGPIIDGPIIYYGSDKGALKLSKVLYPKLYGVNDNFDCLSYFTYYPPHWLWSYNSVFASIQHVLDHP